MIYFIVNLWYFLYLLHPPACDFCCTFALTSIEIWPYKTRPTTFLMLKHVKFGEHIVFIRPKFYKKYAHYKISSQDKVLTHRFFFFFLPIMKFNPCCFGINLSRDDILFPRKRVNSKIDLSIDRDRFIPGWISSWSKLSRVTHFN